MGPGAVMFSVLRIRDYRLVATGQLLSSLGDWLLLVAAPYFVLRLTRSTLATGLSMGAETVPALLLGPVAGVFTDRWDRRRTMLTADLLRAASVALMLLVHHPGQVWLIYLALLAEASFGQFFNPAQQALIPTLVGRGSQLGAANSMAALIGGVVRLVGGPLGGALYALTGFTFVAALDMGSYLASAFLIAAIGRREPDAPPAPGGASWRNFARQMREGVTHIRATPGLPSLFTAAGVLLLGNAALTALLVPYTGTILHATAGTLGLLFGTLGVGYLAGAPISRIATAHLTDRTVMTVSAVTLGAVFAAAFNIHDTAWDLALFALIGPPAVCFLATANTYLARHTPDHLLGRTSSAYGTAQAAATLSGMLAGAILGQRIGIGATVNLAAITVVASAVATLRIPSRNCEHPGPRLASIPAVPEQTRTPNPTPDPGS